MCLLSYANLRFVFFFFFSSRRRHTRFDCDWSSDVCSSDLDLGGKVAIVTGGNGGIGLGMARGLAEAGASVLIAGRDRTKNARATDELREAGAHAIDVVADVTQEESCRLLVAAAVKAFGQLDILVNNAGIGIIKQPQEYT